MRKGIALLGIAITGLGLHTPEASSQIQTPVDLQLNRIEAGLVQLEAAQRSDRSVDTLAGRVARLEAALNAFRNTSPDSATLKALERLFAEIRLLSQELDQLKPGHGGQETHSEPTAHAHGTEDGHSPDSGHSPEDGHDADTEHGTDNGHAGGQDSHALPGGVQLSGFVDAAYVYDQFGHVGTTFALDQMEVNLERILGSLGEIRADLEWVADHHGGFAMDVEQGYLTLAPRQNVVLTFGKFNSPIGFERLDPVDMYQFSHALVFTHGLPTNLTGIMVSSPVGFGTGISLFASNGWDQNHDQHTGKTVGGRLSFDLGERVSGGVSGITEVGTEEDQLTVLDVDVKLQATPHWFFGAEVNRGKGEEEHHAEEWLGWLFMTNYALNHSLAFTVRYDRFEDEEGTRLGSHHAETRQSLAFAPIIHLGHGMEALLEVRRDWSDHDVFGDHDHHPESARLGVALEMVYHF